MSIPMAIILGCLIATSVGLINGLLIVYGKLPPFVVTLGTMSIVKGINLLLTNGIPVSGLPKEFLIVSGNSLLGLSIPVWIMLLLTFLFHYATLCSSISAMKKRVVNRKTVKRVRRVRADTDRMMKCISEHVRLKGQ